MGDINRACAGDCGDWPKVKALLRVIERQQMLFIGVSTFVFTLGTMWCPKSSRSYHARAVIKLRPEGMYPEMIPTGDGGFTPAVLVITRLNPVGIATSVGNSKEFCRRLELPAGVDVRTSNIHAQAGTQPETVEITVAASTPRAAAIIANTAALKLCRLWRQGQIDAHRRVRPFLLSAVAKAELHLKRALVSAKSGGVVKSKEVVAARKELSHYRAALRQAPEDRPIGDVPKVVAWAEGSITWG